MPEHFRRATGRPRDVTDAAQHPTLDLTTLTDQEEKIIQAVIQKDEIERSILEAKIIEVRKEIQEIRKAGALTAGDDQNAICARCKFKFMPFIVPWADHGQRCVTCKFRVCAKCRTQQPGGTWLCILCFKYRQEKQLTGEFMAKGPPAAGPLYGSDLLRASLRDRSSPKVADGDSAGGQRRIESRDVTLVSSTDRLPVPSIAVTTTGVERKKEDEDEDDDLDELFNNHQPNTLLGSRSSLADSRESIYSVYSDAGEVNYGRISVTGEIMFKLNYNHKSNTLEVHIIQCKDLAPVDTKHNKSDPYVKTYLLPDKTRASKRKTRIKKHTLSPIFDEVLKYQLSKAELESRSLWVTVWHNDRFGRNDFLGEVTIPLDYYSYNDNAPQWYPLQERTPAQDPTMGYKGDLFISLKFVTPDMVDGSPKKKSGSLRKKAKEKEKPLSGLGEIHVLVKEAQNLTAMRGSAGSDPFCKGYLLPDQSHGSKQKTPVVRKTTSPQWQHILVFDGVDQCRLPQHGLELTIWDYERLSSNDFLGGVRLNLGQGGNQGKTADWMDAQGEEIEAWQSMMDHPNEWVDAQLPLRISMSKESTKK